MSNASKAKRILFIAVCVVYVFTVLYLTVIRPGSQYDEPQINLIPIVDLIDVFRTAGTGMFIWLFVGNIIWFIPFGYLLSVMLKQKKLTTVIISGFAFSLAIEVTQYFTRKGVAEIDDLILNVLGATIGWSVYKLFTRRKRKMDYKDFVLTYFDALGRAGLLQTGFEFVMPEYDDNMENIDGLPVPLKDISSIYNSIPQ